MEKSKLIDPIREIKDAYIITPTYHDDHRGMAGTIWSSDFRIPGEELIFQEDKIIMGPRGAFRGLHGDKINWKLFFCVKGWVELFLADMRPESPTYLNTYMHPLGWADGDKPWAILVPPGVVNGHLGLQEYALVYKWTTPYTGPEDQITVKYNDPRLRWGHPREFTLIKYISDRDKP